MTKNQDTELTEQYIANRSFDKDFDIQTFELVGYDSAGNVLRRVKVDPSGNLVSTSGLGLPAYDYFSLSSGATTDTWTFKTGGSGGTTVATVTVNYTDSTKETISNGAKT